jgi:ribosomal protein L16 Arg81 hydroxylase
MTIMSERDWDGFDRDELIEEIEDRAAEIEDLRGSLEEWRADFNALAARLRSERPTAAAPGVEALEEAEKVLRAEADRIKHHRYRVGYSDPRDLDRAGRLEDAYLKAASLLARAALTPETPSQGDDE